MFGIFHSILRPFYSSFFIAVNIDAKRCRVKVIQIKHGSLLYKHTRDFNAVDNSLPIDAAKYIRNFKRKYPFVYLSTMARTYSQGVYDKSKSHDNVAIKVAKGWEIYIKKIAIDENRVKYLKALGLDYLFSPFVVIYHNIKIELEKSVKAYILQEQGSLSVVIANKDTLFYAGYFTMAGDLEGNETRMYFEKEENELEMGIADAIGSIADELEEIGELESLDKEVLKREFMPMEITTQIETSSEEQQRLEELKDFARSGSIAEIISSAINEFYTKDNSVFVDSIVMLDTYGMTKQAIFHLEDILLLKIVSKRISLGDTLLQLSQIEMR